MSELKRYTCLSGTAMVTSEDGEYVDYEDADKEIEQLQKAWQIINEANDRQFQEIEKQDAELARLREEKQRIVECPCCGEVFILYSDGTIDAFIGA